MARPRKNPADKKTYLYLTALVNCNEIDKKRLIKLFSETPKDPNNRLVVEMRFLNFFQTRSYELYKHQKLHQQ